MLKFRKIIAKYNENTLVFFLLLFATAVRLRNLSAPIYGSYTWRNTQTAWGIRSVANGVISPFAVELPVLGPPWIIPFEFPLFQLIAGVIARFTGLSVEVSGRLTSITFFISTAIVFYLISKYFFNQLISLLLLLIFLFNAHNLEYGSAVLIEYCAMFFSLSAFLFGLKYLSLFKPNYLILFYIFASIGALVKITTSVIWTLLGSIVLLFIQRSKLRDSLYLLGAGLLSIIPSLAWNYWADEQKSKSNFTYWLTSKNLRTWNFGTIRQRLNIFEWEKSVQQIFLPSVVGSSIVAFLLVVLAILFSKYPRRPVAFLALFSSGPIVFTNLYFVHDYYWTAVIPAFLIVLGFGLNALSNPEVVIAKSVALRIRLFQVIGVMGLVTASCLTPAGNIHFRVFIKEGLIESSTAVDTIKIHTQSSDRIIIIGEDWNPEILYYSNRKGLMVPSSFDPESFIDKDELGTIYKYIFWTMDELIQIKDAQKVVGDIPLVRITRNFFRIEPNLTN